MLLTQRCQSAGSSLWRRLPAADTVGVVAADADGTTLCSAVTASAVAMACLRTLQFLAVLPAATADCCWLRMRTYMHMRVHTHIRPQSTDLLAQKGLGRGILLQDSFVQAFSPVLK